MEAERHIGPGSGRRLQEGANEAVLRVQEPGAASVEEDRRQLV